MPSLVGIEERVWRIFAARDDAIKGLPYSLAVTGVGTPTTLIDSKLDRGSSGTNRYNGRAITALRDGHGAEGEVSYVTDGGFAAATDTLTFSGALTALLTNAASDTYAIWPRGIDPRDVRQNINDVLRNTHTNHLWFPSLVPDSDFEASTTDALMNTNWPDVSTPTSVVDTTAGSALFGPRTFRVTASGADQGIASQQFRVHQDMQMLVSAFLRVEAGTFDVELYRDTATSAVIKSVTVDEEAISEVRFTENITAGTEDARIRFTSNAASDDIYISPPVIVQPTSGYAYPAPSWLVNPQAQIQGALTLAQGYGTDVSDVFRPLTRGHDPAGYREELWRADRWLNPLHIWARPDGGNPVYFECRRPFAELSDLTDMATTNTTPCDEDYLAAAVVARMMKQQGEEEWVDWADEAAKLAKAKGYGDPKGLRIRENEVTLV